MLASIQKRMETWYNDQTRKRVVAQPDGSKRCGPVKSYYPSCSINIRTYQLYICSILGKKRTQSIHPHEVDIVYDMLYDIAAKTNHIWPESHKKINKIIDQYPYMSVYGWVYLVYTFLNNMYDNIINNVTCGSDFNFSQIIDVLINNVNFRWRLPMSHIDLISKPPEPRSWSSNPIKLSNNSDKTVLSFMSRLN